MQALLYRHTLIHIYRFNIFSIFSCSTVASPISVHKMGSSCMEYGGGIGKEVVMNRKSSHVAGGPWGGQGGSRWDDGVYCSIRQMIITHGTVIDSVQIEYDTRGCSVWSEKHGGSGGVKTDKLKLDHPDEHLLSVSGCYGAVYDTGPVVVRSLLFETNRRRFGPFGVQKGTHFSFSLTGGKIVGFFGKSGLHLDSLGVYLKPFVNVRTVVQQGQGVGVGVAHKGVGNGGGGNRGYDIMVAVREKMDNMILNAAGFADQFESREKVYSSDGVEGNVHNVGQVGVGREREKFTFVKGYKDGSDHQAYEPAYYDRDTDNQAYLLPAYEDTDQAYNKHHSVILCPNPQLARGVPLGARQGAREKENYMQVANHDHAFSEYETREKVYNNVGAEKAGYNNIFTRDTGFTEYETKEKVYNSSGGAQKPMLVSPATGRSAVSYGPWGGSGGMLFDDGVFTGVREIHLSRTAGVVSIRVCYDMNGQAVWGNKHGGTGAIRVDKISLDYPNEVLTRVSGYYGSTVFRGPTVVKSATLFSNKQKYGPFGEEQGIPFSSGQKEGLVVGFHGRKGWFLDSIGVHFLERKLSSPIPRPRNCDIYTTATTATTDHLRLSDQVYSGPVKVPIQSGPAGPLAAVMVKEPALYGGNGPWGGNGGSRWDDGVFTGIKKIFLTKGCESIYAIQIEYDCNGRSTWSAKHGNNNEGSCHVIKFEYPQEVLTHISGYYGSIRGDESEKVVKSLTFHSNRGVYGPYGEEIGTHFASAKAQSKIVGFHGNSGCHLYAIGVNTQPYSFTDQVNPGTIKTMLHKIFAS